MPHQFSNGMQGYNNSHNQLSPTSQVGSLVPANRGGPAVGGGGGLPPGDFGALIPSTGPSHRIEEKRLTREAMERYLKDRNDMVLVILHAKVSPDCLRGN